ncbi:MAG TPA: type IX secretion system membrane protein PorP/SprF [Phaeodactylibacter sp.]|nr:type IX secretion system membrane protein PorP/SprF [Phaeodactylibacter sp.]
MNRLILTIALVLCYQILSAQQIPLFTQYRQNLGILNPAALNSDFHTSEHHLSFGVSYRTQWVGFDATPVTQTIRGEYLLDNGGGVGLLFGGYLVNDQTGPTGFTGAYGRFAGILTDDPTYGGLSIGLSVGVVQYRVRGSELFVRDPGDVLSMEDQSKIFPDVGLGIYYYKTLDGGGALDDDIFYSGLSVPQVFGLNLDFKNENGDFSTQRIQHFYGLLGLYHFFENDGLLEPSVWIKYAPNAPINVDFNLRYQFPGSMWLGTGLSTAGTYHLETGFAFGENLGWDSVLKIGYGFDYSFNTFGPDVGNTHEINLSFSLE